MSSYKAYKGENAIKAELLDLFKQVSQCIMISCPTNQEFKDMYQEEQWEDMLFL